MTTTDSTTRTPPQPWTRIADGAFAVLLLFSVLAGIVLVLTQAAALAFLDGGIVVGVADALGPWVYAAAAAAGVLSLVASYLHGWGSAD